MPNITISFLEREYFAEDRTGTTIRGYEPAIIKTGNRTRLGKVIGLDRMDTAQSIETLLFQTSFPLIDSEIDLTPILSNDKNGLKWLSNHQKYHADTYGKKVPMTLSITSAQIPKRTEYTLFPEDYFKRKRPYPPQEQFSLIFQKELFIMKFFLQ